MARSWVHKCTLLFVLGFWGEQFQGIAGFFVDDLVRLVSQVDDSSDKWLFDVSDPAVASPGSKILILGEPCSLVVVPSNVV